MTTAETKMAGSMPRPPKEPDKKTYLGRVALRLKALRLDANLQHGKAAEKITEAGYVVAESTIYRWEQGKTQPHIQAIPAIAKAYRVELRDVLPER